MNIPTPLTAVLEQISNRLLYLDADTLRRLGKFRDKVICIEIITNKDTESLRGYVSPSESGMRFYSEVSVVPDVTITGDPMLFARLFLGRTRPVAGDLKISGDIELGQNFKRILERIDIDWEEQVAQRLGDVPAHSLGNTVRGLRTWARQTRYTLGLDVAEYLQEEIQLLAKRERVDAFVRATDTLRADIDRLEQRVKRLLR